MEKKIQIDGKEQKTVWAEPNKEYHGRIVAIQSDVVVQRDSHTNQLVAHRPERLTGGRLTLGQETKIRYPDSKVGLIYSEHESRSEVQREHHKSKDISGPELER